MLIILAFMILVCAYLLYKERVLKGLMELLIVLMSITIILAPLCYTVSYLVAKDAQAIAIMARDYRHNKRLYDKAEITHAIIEANKDIRVLKDLSNHYLTYGYIPRSVKGLREIK